MVHRQAIKGAQNRAIAADLEKHAGGELDHAILLAKHIDHLGGVPAVTPKGVKISDKPEDLLRFDLDNELTTIANYRQRLRQAETLSEFAVSEALREIIKQEQDHAIDLSGALGMDVPAIPAG